MLAILAFVLVGAFVVHLLNWWFDRRAAERDGRRRGSPVEPPRIPQEPCVGRSDNRGDTVTYGEIEGVH